MGVVKGEWGKIDSRAPSILRKVDNDLDPDSKVTALPPAPLPLPLPLPVPAPLLPPAPRMCLVVVKLVVVPSPRPTLFHCCPWRPCCGVS